MIDMWMSGSGIRFLAMLYLRCYGYFSSVANGQDEGISVFPFPEMKQTEALIKF